MRLSNHLLQLALRHSTKHPVQSLLLILGVALGVAMIVAIDLANSSASQAFTLSTNSIAGKATHQIVAEPDDARYREGHDVAGQGWVAERQKVARGLMRDWLARCPHPVVSAD